MATISLHPARGRRRDDVPTGVLLYRPPRTAASLVWVHWENVATFHEARIAVSVGFTRLVAGRRSAHERSSALIPSGDAERERHFLA